MTTFVGLIRGINVGGSTRVPMAELRTAMESAGLGNPRTYIQSGNLVFESDQAREELEKMLSELIRSIAECEVPVIVRPADRWKSLVAANPLLKEAEADPSRFMMGLAVDDKIAEGAVDCLQGYAKADEVIRTTDGVLWIYFPAGSGTSKISPAVLNRCAGSPVTLRNWRTAQKLLDMIGAG